MVYVSRHESRLRWDAESTIYLPTKGQTMLHLKGRFGMKQMSLLNWTFQPFLYLPKCGLQMETIYRMLRNIHLLMCCITLTIRFFELCNIPKTWWTWINIGDQDRHVITIPKILQIIKNLYPYLGLKYGVHLS